MITTNDLYCFYKWCINDNVNVSRNKEKFFQINDIVKTFLEDEENIPIPLKNKVDLLLALLKSLMDGNNVEGSISNVLGSPRYKNEIDFIDLMKTSKVTNEDMDHILKTIENKSKHLIISKSMKKLEDLFGILRDGSYNSTDESYEVYTDLVNTLHNNTKTINNIYAMASESEFKTTDLDSLNKTAKLYIKKYDRTNKIPTGFDYIDDHILRGGLDNNRLYIIAGSSGAGKSTILINWALNGAKSNRYVGEIKRKKKIFLYITLENDKEETYGRLLCSHWGISEMQLLRILHDDGLEEVNKKFVSEMNKFNSTIEIRTFRTESISCSSISAMIDSLIEENGGNENCMVAAVYLDYLDLIKCDNGKKDHRLNLTSLTQELKDLAREHEIPVVTATQLNREGYNITSAYQLNSKAMGESMGKIHIADFVAMISLDSLSSNRVFWRVVKFRSGNLGSPLDFYVDFEKFKFISCEKSKTGDSKEIECKDTSVTTIPDGLELIKENKIKSKNVEFNLPEKFLL